MIRGTTWHVTLNLPALADSTAKRPRPMSVAVALSDDTTLANVVGCAMDAARVMAGASENAEEALAAVNGAQIGKVERGTAVWLPPHLEAVSS